MINKKLKMLENILDPEEIKLIKDQNLDDIDCGKIKEILGIDDIDINCKDVDYLLDPNNEVKGIFFENPDIEDIIIFLILIFYIYCIFRFIENDFIGILINLSVFFLIIITAITLLGYTNFNIFIIIGIAISLIIINYLLNKVLSMKTKRIIYNILIIFFMFFNLIFLYR